MLKVNNVTQCRNIGDLSMQDMAFKKTVYYNFSEEELCKYLFCFGQHGCSGQ
jgi:hypothetical protein